ncbi:MAG TPA: hypothetical protein VFX24_01475 [Ktedonobacterales bacterium]|jgi:hypothetical protein|nr:hypothetical protein [Ktedonobacterales bacterium]
MSAPILWLTALYDLFESRRVVLQARKALHEWDSLSTIKWVIIEYRRAWQLHTKPF